MPRPRSIVMCCAAIAAPAFADNPIPYPHPQITEVLFNVPPGGDGDADGSGERDATGDEFIEIANPFDRPVQLEGYTLSSRLSSPEKDTGKGVRFVFPRCELPAHGVAVVFNGFGDGVAGVHGTGESAPDSGNARFGGALVFSMGTKVKHRALSNSGDFIVLCAPDGTALDCVAWGEPSPAPPSGALRLEAVPANPKGSVQRVKPGEPLAAHREIDSKACSPGTIPDQK